MKKIFKSSFSTFGLILLLSITINSCRSQSKTSETIEDATERSFLGIFTHTEPVLGMDDKIESLKKVLAQNPYISGVTIKIRWKDFHPTKEKIEWEKLEELIEIASSNGKLVRLGIFGGYFSPDWVYDEGCWKVEASRGTTTVPWDKKFMKLFSADVKAVAKRYANDSRVFMVGVVGHNYKGEEMHAPSEKYFKDYNWSEEIVLDNWKYWIDLYDSLYPNKQLNLVVSQMYPQRHELPRKVTAYFLEKCIGRAVLQTDQLNGREAKLPLSGQICKEYSNMVANGHETVGSFKEQPKRQGTAEMTIYKLRLMGNPLFIQLWRRDCDDPKYSKALLDVIEEYKKLSLDEMKARLIKEGLFVEKSDYKFVKKNQKKLI